MEDRVVRTAAFDWLKEQVARYDDVLPWKLLIKGFEIQGHRVPLVSMQGIFKPAVMSLPLSIRTSLEGPYDDRAGAEGKFLYAYRGTDPNHPDNAGLRELKKRRLPLVHFFGITKGRYLPAWPVFISDDNPQALYFTVQLDDAAVLSYESDEAGYAVADDMGDERRRYITRELKVRLHQRAFRERVLRAYREQCALCRLRHRELLDAAHIIPDSEEQGEANVRNGLSLCKLHHAAFDRLFIGIRPDYVIEIRKEILDEDDGPMLLHGLKGLHNEKMYLPRNPGNWPDPRLLEQRFERFLNV